MNILQGEKTKRDLKRSQCCNVIYWHILTAFVRQTEWREIPFQYNKSLPSEATWGELFAAVLQSERASNGASRWIMASPSKPPRLSSALHINPHVSSTAPFVHANVWYSLKQIHLIRRKQSSCHSTASLSVSALGATRERRSWWWFCTITRCSFHFYGALRRWLARC